MKKNFNFALVGAIALTGAMMFSACSESSEIVDNPDYNPETNSVKTQFTISLPNNVGESATRQESGIVQSDDNGTTLTFRGMDNILLVPYSLGSGNVLVNSTANGGAIALSGFDVFQYASSNSKVYADVALNVGTTNFLIYGKAKDASLEAAITTAADKFNYGTLERTGLADNAIPTLSEVEFSPVSIDESKTAVGTSLIQALNDVADAVPAENLSSGDKPKFKEVTSEQNAAIYHVFEIYKSLTTASSFSVNYIFDGIYSSLESMVTETMQTSNPDGYKLAKAVRDAIDAQRKTAGASGLKDALKDYPSELPNGAVRVAWNATNKIFEAATNANYGTGLNVTTLDKYVYPANLYYWVNSPLKVSNSKQSPNYLDKAWNTGTGNVLSLYGDGTTVSVSTQSVAVTNQLQYGVGRLNAKINKMSADKYYDHDGVEVDITAGFTLTGILIGGQKSVGWDFDVKGSTEYTIYDKVLASGGSWTVTSSTATDYNHTLALQTTADQSVYVALELVNKGAEFKGADGVIPVGGKFYLVGELKPSAATDYAASTTGKDRVFTQDYKTIADFTIKAGSGVENNPDGLGSATNGLPDLRATQKELGLSVNLTWQPGLHFDIDI